MNATVGNASVGFTYFDLLDGEYMACSGAPGALAYQPTCFYLRYVLGTLGVVESLFFARLCLMYKRRLNLQHAAQRAKMTASKPRSTLPNGEDTRSTVLVGPTALKLLKSKFANYVCMVAILVSAASFALISGFGTVYPTQSTPGKVGDLLMALLFACIVQFSGLKEKESHAFQAIVELPGIGRVQKRSCLAQVKIQKFLPFPIGLALWTLLVEGRLSRSHFVAVMFSTHAVSGVRMLYISVSKRLFTLSKIHTIQKFVGDSKGDGGRKVEKRTRRLLIEMAVTMIAGIVTPLSLLVLGSIYSSAQMAIHLSVVLTFTLLALAGFLRSEERFLGSEWRNQSRVGASGGGSGRSRCSESSLQGLASMRDERLVLQDISDIASS